MKMREEYRDQAPMPELESKILECPSKEEACAKAAEEWGIRLEDVEAEIISEDKKLFGLFGKNLRVEVTPVAPVPFIKSCYFVNEMLERMDVDLVPELTEDGIVNLVGEDQGVAIGRYGETIKAIEYLTNLICHQDMSTRRVRFDCGGYRERRAKTLTRLAESIAREAVKKNAPVTLEPMTSWERRIIHIALRENDSVETRSIGEDPSRRITVYPAAGERKPAKKRRRR